MITYFNSSQILKNCSSGPQRFFEKGEYYGFSNVLKDTLKALDDFKNEQQKYMK